MALFESVRQSIAAPRARELQFAIVVAGVALAAFVRWIVDRGTGGVPFLTFIPVVILSAIFLEWHIAVLGAATSLVTVIVLFGHAARTQFVVQNYFLWAAFSIIAAFIIVVGHVLRQTILDLYAQSEMVRAFNAELQHRTKNTLQIVRALASRAARSTDPAEFYRTLSGRLDAMAKANELLGGGIHEERLVSELVTAAMQPFPAWAIQARGPACMIAGEPGMQLMMALHELGTNAVKYGALSIDGGHVMIGWHDGGGAVDLLWEERGGPPVTAPTKLGLGSRILSPGGAFKTVETDYSPGGLICRIAVCQRLKRPA